MGPTPHIEEPRDLERYPQDRRTVRWRGEYVVALLCLTIVVLAILYGRGIL